MLRRRSMLARSLSKLWRWHRAVPRRTCPPPRRPVRYQWRAFRTRRRGLGRPSKKCCPLRKKRRNQRAPKQATSFSMKPMIWKPRVNCKLFLFCKLQCAACPHINHNPPRKLLTLFIYSLHMPTLLKHRSYMPVYCDSLLFNLMQPMPLL